MADNCISPRITSPESFFGFQLGSDRKLARWDKIIDYFYKLASESDNIKVVEMGKTCEGNPFLLVIISSAKNLRDLERQRQINNQLADPRGLTEDAIRALIKEGKAVVCQSMSMHATEVGGTQMAPELAYDLLARDTEENRRILDEVIFLMVPCFNPDGEIYVADWYEKMLGTEYEGTNPPYLYQKYSGHDNNRDAFAQNLPDSRYMGELLFTKWHPQAYQDHHHMGPFGPRLFIAPYSDAIRPFADPLVWREDSWYGAHMAYTLEEQGKTGVLNAGQYPGWGHFSFHWIATHHNIPGMLTESASAKLATPMYVHPHQLKGGSAKTHPKNEEQTNFPHPWPGGWWRLRDIVEQQKISAWALLDICARYREKVLWNTYLKAKRQTERGAAMKPDAFAISPDQHDPLTALKLIDLLLLQGIEVKRAEAEFRAEGRVFPAGTFLVSMAQPKMGVIKYLLGQTFYPDYYWTRNPDGSPIMYDTATDTIGEFMGIRIVPLDSEPRADFLVVSTVERPAPAVVASAGYLLDGRLNDSFLAVNRLLAKGAKVWRLDAPVDAGTCDCGCKQTLPAGAFYVENVAALAEDMTAIARETGLAFIPVAAAPTVAKHEISNLRVAIYQRFWGGNADEGWTRLVFERFGFPFTPVHDAEIKSGKLRDSFDVLIIPADRERLLVGPDNMPEKPGSRAWPIPPAPPEYRSGLGKDGAQAVADFVKAGGRLVAFDTSSDWAIQACGLKVRNVVADASWKEFYCNGSTLHARVNTADPLAYGMPEDALVINMGSPTFEITEAFWTDNYRIIAEYPKKDLLESGWLIGEDRIADKACMVAARVGKGEVVLIGFRTQFRAQAHGTYKFLFNCLY
ncbi:MAG: M14 family zinc carboxypeptidase [Chloroflexota bacterium]